MIKKYNLFPEPSIEEQPIGSYGMKWIAFMEENHPNLVRELKKANRFLTVARSVDDEAWEYRELLDRQYMELHSRPHGFEEIVKWEYTRAFYTDSAVMRERVLVPVTDC